MDRDGGSARRAVPHPVVVRLGRRGDLPRDATASRTARNLAVSPTARLALGHTRDVVLVDGRAELLPLGARAPDDADAFASRAGFDPRDADAEYVWIRVAPTRIQAWREVEELAARDLLRDGAWLD